MKFLICFCPMYGQSCASNGSILVKRLLITLDVRSTVVQYVYPKYIRFRLTFYQVPLHQLCIIDGCTSVDFVCHVKPRLVIVWYILHWTYNACLSANSETLHLISFLFHPVLFFESRAFSCVHCLIE